MKQKTNFTFLLALARSNCNSSYGYVKLFKLLNDYCRVYCDAFPFAIAYLNYSTLFERIHGIQILFV